LPNINDINGVTVANLAKLDAVLKANISKVNGLTLAAGFTGLLDETYGTDAEFAFSVRRLSSTTTVLMRVRRDTNTGGAEDDDEADVGYDANNELSLDSPISNASAGVTATTLGEFINVGTVGGTTYSNPDSLTVTASCWVDSWYDQTGNGYHAEQNGFLVQPRLHDGTVNTDLIQINGKPALQTNTSTLTDQQLTVSVVSGSIARPWTVTGVAEGNGNNPFWSSNRRVYQTTGNLRLSATGQITVTMDASPQCMYLGMCTTTGTNSVIAGSTSATQTSATATVSNANDLPYSAFNIGNRPSFNQGGHQQELIAWAADETGNKTSIETNVNSNYLIYQPTDQPTSGLLYDYGSATGGTDAAAAYSVRQLSDKAVICMRIRRDSDDEERNIGFDSNGDLDTQAISDFCQTANGYVTRWWDQSVNGNHADQPVGGTGSNASQPQIYDGSAVITGVDNKPAIKFIRVYGTHFTTPNFDTYNSGWLCCAVAIKQSGTGDQYFIDNFGGATERTATWFQTPGADLTTRQGGDNQTVTASISTLTDYLWTSRNDGSTLELYVNGSSQGSASFTNQNDTNQGFDIGKRYGNLAGYSDNIASEIILWPSDQSSNRTGIETDINNYFSIY